jgi:anthranilate synthase component 1/salicylate synthetase
VSEQRDDVFLDHFVEIENDPLESIFRLTSLAKYDNYFVYENAGVWTFAGGVLAELWIDGEGVHLNSPEVQRDVSWSGDPFAQVQLLFDELPYLRWCAYGWAAFELTYARAGGGPGSRTGGERLLHLVVPRTEVRITGGGARIRSVDEVELKVVEEALLDCSVTHRPGSYAPVDVRGHGAREYEASVERAVRDIKDRVLDKVVLSRTVPVATELDFVETFIAGRRANNPARSFLMSLDGLDALGFSPEVVVRVENGVVMSQPLAGTRALTADPAENLRLRKELLADPKEVFEHAVSVKAVYDELEQVCDADSLAVGEFMNVRERGSVQHLASRISGRLATGRRAWDAFDAVFPGVTASGVPKEAALAHIREHEPQPRGLYGAAVITFDHEGTLDAALVLRAIYRQHGLTWLRAGGGIVAQSVPSRELEETTEKLGSVARFLVPSVIPAAPEVAGAGSSD